MREFAYQHLDSAEFFDVCVHVYMHTEAHQPQASHSKSNSCVKYIMWKMTCIVR